MLLVMLTQFSLFGALVGIFLVSLLILLLYNLMDEILVREKGENNWESEQKSKKKEVFGYLGQ